MKKLFLIMFLFALKSNAQYMKIYANGGCVMMVDSANTIKSCDSQFRFQTNESTSTVTISTDTRKFANYRYTQVKKADGTNLASSFSDLLTKLGELQSTIQNSTVSISPISVSYSCLPITLQTIYAAGIYKEICISPVTGTYTLRTGSNTANSGLFNIATLKNEQGGYISNITTITPTGTGTVCTKQ